MKRYNFVFLSICLTLLLTALVGVVSAMAQTNAPVQVPSDVTQFITDHLGALMVKAPWIAGLFSIMGAARVFAKPVMTLIEMYVIKTKTTADDQLLARAQTSAWWKWVAWIVDYLTSIKIGPQTPITPQKQPLPAANA